ncbi:amidohydrolase [Rheinheimera sp. SA_1]|uniref:amidohydrolase n=1 Tax=Rheinheimera sp. SA_1 TaxID=1827365 RepID=UPI0007FC65D0|nr:amidohydrolase [Rheinheimera sp. SA_1]OBP17050.1 amidohydrolase [Rheinheimera sp. SA_1]
MLLSRVYSAVLLTFVTATPALAAPVIVDNIQGYGFDDKRTLVPFQSLVFDDATGKVLARGDATLAKNYPTATKIDGQGKTLLPGLIDGHGHVLGLGQNLAQVDLRTSSSEAQAVAKVAAFAKTQPQAQWILGRGWNQVLWPTQQFPSTTLLDEEINDKPVWLSRVDGHAGWANSKALQLAGITKDSIDPPGGQILRDDKGNPTGVLIDNAMVLLEKKIPQQNEAERQAALAAAFQHLLALGITSTHDAGIDAANLASYQTLQQQKKIPMRIYAMLNATDPHFRDWLKTGPIDDAADVLDVRSVKIVGDGALGSRGAALLADYSDKAKERGLLVTQPDALTHLMKMTIDAGFQANVHAIGDHANRMVLDRFMLLANDKDRQASRHRVEHAQIVAPVDIPRFAKLHVLPSMQPTHATSDKNMAGDRLGVARLRGAYAWRSFVDQGSIIVGGSDYPVELANPFYGLHAAVTRQDQQNQPAGGWLPEQKLTVTEALRSFTTDAAYGAYQEKTMGSLQPGMWADFILIDRDLTQVPPEQIWQTQVLHTYVGGKQVYSHHP